MPSLKPIASALHTPDAALKRNKLQFNSVIERMIALAHGLPPPPDSSSSSSQRKRPRTPHPRKHNTRTGKITKADAVLPPSTLRRVSNLVLRSPSSSIEEDIVQEVEESLQRRKKELGLGDDYVCQEVGEDDPRWHHCTKEKKAAKNTLTVSQNSKRSLSVSRKQNLDGHAPGNSGSTRELKLVDENRLPTNRGEKKKEMSSVSKQITNLSTRKSSSESPPKKDRKKLKDLSNNGKLRIPGQTKLSQKRDRKKKKISDVDDELSSSTECNLPRKRDRKKKESLNNDRLSPNDENNPAKKRGREEIRGLDNDGKLSSSDECKSPKKSYRKRKEGLTDAVKLMSNAGNKSPKKKRGRRIKESPAAKKSQESPAAKKSQKSPEAKKSQESPAAKKSQPARTKTLAEINTTPSTSDEMRKSGSQHKEQIQVQSEESDIETVQNKPLSEEGTPEEQECESSPMHAAIRKAVQAQAGSHAQIIHMVQEGENILCVLDCFTTVHITLSQAKETQTEQQTARGNTEKQDMDTLSGQQSKRIHANREKEIETEQQTARRNTEKQAIDTPLEQRTKIIHANKEKETETDLEQRDIDVEETNTVPEQRTTRGYPNKEKKSETELELQTIKTHIRKRQSPRLVLCIRRMKEAEQNQNQQTHASNKEAAIVEKVTRSHQVKKAKTKKLQSIAACDDRETNTQQQQQKQETIRETKALSQAVSEVLGKIPGDSELRTAVAEKSDVVLVSIPVPHAKEGRKALRKPRQIPSTSSESPASPKTAPREPVTCPVVNSRVPEVTHTAEDVPSSPPPQQDQKRSNIQESERSSSPPDSKANSSKSESDSTDQSLVGTETVVYNGNVSNSSPGLPCQSTTDTLKRKRKLDIFTRTESEEEDGECSATSDENDTMKELNVRKRRKRSSFPYQLPRLPNKKKPKKHSKSSHTVNDDDDDEDIIILQSAMPTPSDGENDPNRANGVDGKHKPPSVSHTSPKKPAQAKGHLPEKRASNGHHRNLTNSSFSQSFAYSFLGRQRQLRRMAAAAAQSRDKESDLGDTWNLLQIPPLQNTSLTSGIGTSLQGSQLLETTSIRAQVTASTTTTGAISGRLPSAKNTLATSTNSATQASQQGKSFWAIDSDEEAENGSFAIGLQSRSTILSSAFTSASQESPRRRKTPLPDYSTLGPERFMAAVKALQKDKQTSFLRFQLS